MLSGIILAMKTTLLSCWLAFLSSTRASALPATPSQGQELASRTACENTATSRGCWGVYDIFTNWRASTRDLMPWRWLLIVIQVQRCDRCVKFDYACSANLTAKGQSQRFIEALETLGPNVNTPEWRSSFASATAPLLTGGFHQRRNLLRKEDRTPHPAGRHTQRCSTNTKMCRSFQ